jgi:3-carboxy-cis,cis-muconate cycloisomerase
MRTNLERSPGLVFSEALALRLSRPLADRLCKQALREQKHLRDVMKADAEVCAHMKAAEIEALLDPQHTLGAAAAMIERVLADWQAKRA